eukprot:1704661-Alexandrium_andersonii.AAC.1
MGPRQTAHRPADGPPARRAPSAWQPRPQGRPPLAQPAQERAAPQRVARPAWDARRPAARPT